MNLDQAAGERNRLHEPHKTSEVRTKHVLEAEIRPRMRLAENLAIQAALGVDPIDPVDALLFIAKLLGTADRHASTT
jgi:hypothetical protein